MTFLYTVGFCEHAIILSSNYVLLMIKTSTLWRHDQRAEVSYKQTDEHKYIATYADTRTESCTHAYTHVCMTVRACVCAQVCECMTVCACGHTHIPYV